VDNLIGDVLDQVDVVGTDRALHRMDDERVGKPVDVDAVKAAHPIGLVPRRAQPVPRDNVESGSVPQPAVDVEADPKITQSTS
jgi:hypothetical protein